MKGPRSYVPAERTQAWLNTLVVLTTPSSDVPRTVRGPIGEANLNQDMYGPIIAALAEDRHKPKRLQDLVAQPQLRSMQFPNLVEAVVVLAGAGHVSPRPADRRHDEKAMRRPEPLCLREVSQLLRNRVSGLPGHRGRRPRFALRATVPALTVSRQAKRRRTRQVCLGLVLKGLNQRVVRDGKALETDDENLAEIRGRAELFLKRLPCWKPWV